ncbi:MAG: acuB [Gammaproteobacteria bacterium]|nr:acuB [Gammaproteobacteria bacterium]
MNASIKRQELVHMAISEVMNPYLLTVDPYASLAEAYELMKKNKIRRLPVVNNNELVGVITHRDILEAKPSDVTHSLSIWELNQMLSKLIVEHVMTRKPITIYQTDTVGHAAEIMLDEKIGGIPVLDANDKLTGIITESDIFRLIMRRWRDDNMLRSRTG